MTSLTTRRLTLRPPRGADAEALVAALNNLNVSRWTGRIPHPYGPQDALDFFNHVGTAPAEALILFIERQGRLIGGIGIEQEELGYWLAEPYWGQGYATEAARAIVDHAFEARSHERLIASYYLGNAASRRILLGLGFMELGEASAYSKARQAEVPHMRMLLTREDWKTARERRR